MRSTCLRSLLLCGTVAGLVGCGGSGGTSLGSNAAPVVIASVPAGGLAYATGKAVTFQVQVTDPDGDDVSLRLKNPPPGMTLLPISSQPSPQTVVVRWTVPDGATVTPPLVFEANDDVAPATLVELRIPTRCVGGPVSAVLHGDVTGDGIEDVVGLAHLAGTLDTGAIYVWPGSSSPVSNAAPLILRIPNTVLDDRLGSCSGQALHLEHVTGGAALDIVAVATNASTPTADAGGVYVWKGGPIPTFWARLEVPGALSGDLLGTGSGQGIQFGDVCGDASTDIVVSAYNADLGIANNAGAVYVWTGGAALTAGAPAPIQLKLASPFVNDYLGRAGGQGVQLVPLFGSTKLDIVASTPTADQNGSNAGAIHVWRGAPSLASGPPTHTLVVAGATPGDLLGDPFAGASAVQFADVTGDGVLDVVAAAPEAKVGAATQAGALYVWSGSTITAPVVSAGFTLTSAAPNAFDQLGRVASGPGFFLTDVTGEGDVDIVACAPKAKVGTVLQAGVVYVWKGGLGFSSTPLATLTTGTPFANDELGNAPSGQGISFGDVTDDGFVDLVVSAVGADRTSSVADTGAVYVWAGGPTLAGALAPTARLTVTGASANDRLGNVTGQGVLLADVTGEGVLDVTAGASQAKVGTQNFAGALYVWRGGATLAGAVPPDFTLTSPTATANDKIGFSNSSTSQAIQIADVSGDGRNDIVASAHDATVGSQANAGAVFVWFGGASISPSPNRTLTSSAPTSGDRLSWADGQGVQIVDISNDGQPDLVVGAKFMKLGSSAGVGAVLVWVGGSSLANAPTSVLVDPAASPSDNLGSSAGGQAVHVADVTGDGLLDLLAIAQLADKFAADSGAIFVWKLTGGLPPTFSATATLVDGSAVLGDQLGW